MWSAVRHKAPLESVSKIHTEIKQERTNAKLLEATTKLLFKLEQLNEMTDSAT